MMDYIKKLRACVRQFQDLEMSLTLDKEDLRRQLDDEKEIREQSGKACPWFVVVRVFGHLIEAKLSPSQ